ncbi:MAG: ABC transporter ATP-binding protein, partial [Gammaproteobacteria bacterium]
MPKNKKPSVIQRLLPYMGEKRYLLPLSLVLSAISAVLGLLPFVFIWLITRIFFADTGNEAVNFSSVSLYAWLTLGSAFLAML